MSHRILSTTVRILAAAFLAVIAVGAVGQAGSQMPPTPERHQPPSLPGGTVVLHVRADHAGETVLDLEVRSVRPRLQLSGDTKKANGADFSWRLHCGVEIMSDSDLIRFDLHQAVLQGHMKSSRLNLSFQASALLTDGEEKILFRNDEVTLRVTAVFEKEGT